MVKEQGGDLGGGGSKREGARKKDRGSASGERAHSGKERCLGKGGSLVEWKRDEDVLLRGKAARKKVSVGLTKFRTATSPPGRRGHILGEGTHRSKRGGEDVVEGYKPKDLRENELRKKKQTAKSLSQQRVKRRSSGEGGALGREVREFAE